MTEITEESVRDLLHDHHLMAEHVFYGIEVTPLEEVADDLAEAYLSKCAEVRELRERVQELEASNLEDTKENEPQCVHDPGGLASYDHVTCIKCGSIKTDGMWGIASNKWFKSYHEAEFYKRHGRLPE